MTNYSNTALKILQLLLRCGMVCREELNVVLEMMPAIPDSRTDAMTERSATTAGGVKMPGSATAMGGADAASLIDNIRARG